MSTSSPPSSAPVQPGEVLAGKFKVERAAQKTDAEMAHNALLIEQGAEVFAKPELEIYADDVKCSHGATSVQIDEDEMFYLLARGIPPAVARQLLVGGFLNEVLERLPERILVEKLEAISQIGRAHV